VTYEGSLTFAKVIEEHLELKRRNARLEDDMPIGSYRSDTKTDNHPLFKTEEQARFEETMSGTQPGLDRELVMAVASARTRESTEDESFWRRSRDFDWGD
jgi:hypothetical protein